MMRLRQKFPCRQSWIRGFRKSRSRLHRAKGWVGGGGAGGWKFKVVRIGWNFAWAMGRVYTFKKCIPWMGRGSGGGAGLWSSRQDISSELIEVWWWNLTWMISKGKAIDHHSNHCQGLLSLATGQWRHRIFKNGPMWLEMYSDRLILEKGSSNGLRKKMSTTINFCYIEL